MHSLVYLSNAQVRFDNAALEELANRAGEKNRALNITGFLYFRDVQGTFLQYLEGAREPLDALMAEIADDERHEIEQVLRLDPRPQRVFPEWSMRRVSDSDFEGIRLEDVAAQIISGLAIRATNQAAANERIESIVTRIAELARRPT